MGDKLTAGFPPPAHQVPPSEMLTTRDGAQTLLRERSEAAAMHVSRARRRLFKPQTGGLISLQASALGVWEAAFKILAA